LKFLLIFKSEF